MHAVLAHFFDFYATGYIMGLLIITSDLASLVFSCHISYLHFI